MENSDCSCRSYRSCVNHLFRVMKIEVNSKFNFAFKRKCNLYCISFALLVYAVNKIWLINLTAGAVEVFCRSFLNDLVCPLFFLGFANILFLWAGFELNSYLKCIAVGMTCGLIWEYFAPVINTKATSDPWDLLCYFIGISIYYLLFRIEVNSLKESKRKWVKKLLKKK